MIIILLLILCWMLIIDLATSFGVGRGIHITSSPSFRIDDNTDKEKEVAEVNAEDIRQMNVDKLREWLKPKLDEEDWNDVEPVIRKQRIKGKNFLNYNWEMWTVGGIPGGVADSLVQIAQEAGAESKAQALKKKKLNYIQLAPSSFGYQWHEYMGQNTNYLIGRVNRCFRLPGQLLCPIFGQFAHRFHKYEAQKNISLLVDELCYEMEQHYVSEREREAEFHRIFREIIGTKIAFSKIERSGVTSDGSILHPSTNCVVLNLEIKNEIGLTGDAFMQNMQYFVYFLVDKTSPACRPCFLVEVVGPNICVSGALVAKDHFCLRQVDSYAFSR
jgi:hypothetical protein